MTKSRRLTQMLRAAERDIAAARKLLPELADQAIFHAQQAAEKTARAVAEAEGRTPGRSHHIGQIAELLPAGHPFRADLMGFDILSSAATAWRYPTPGGHMPEPPPPDLVARHLDDIAALLPRIGDWLRDRSLA
ncbi:MAG: HEPN domain-containing protein [Alphaproteobacteria bacterium]|nr:HEPN domain-containing protein [Alphaproteobacteria bacterium]